MSGLTVERVRQIARGATDHAVMLAESGDFDAHVDWVKTLAEAWLSQADALAAAETREAGLRAENQRLLDALEGIEENDDGWARDFARNALASAPATQEQP